MKMRLIIISLILALVLGSAALVAISKKINYDSINCEAIYQENKERTQSLRSNEVEIAVDYTPEATEKCF